MRLNPIGTILILTGLVLLGLDVATLAGTGDWHPATIGSLWTETNGAALDSVTAYIARAMGPDAHNLFDWLLRQPLSALAAGLGMIVILYRYGAWLMLVAAIGLLGWELFQYLLSKQWHPISANTLWEQIHAASLYGTKLLVSRNMSQVIWDLMVAILEGPAWLVLFGASLLAFGAAFVASLPLRRLRSRRQRAAAKQGGKARKQKGNESDTSGKPTDNTPASPIPFILDDIAQSRQPPRGRREKAA